MRQGTWVMMLVGTIMSGWMLPACGSSTSGCKSDRDCAADESCIEGVCESNNSGTCATDTDCLVSGQICEQGTCKAKCTTDESCAAGTYCSVSGRCVIGCRGDSECQAAGQKCVNHRCTTPSCTKDTECTLGKKCLEGSCQAAPCQNQSECGKCLTCTGTAGSMTCTPSNVCVSDKDCTGGQSCVNCACVAAAACTKGDDCKSTETCRSGTCTSGDVCTNKTDCHTGQNCLSGHCNTAQCIVDNDCGNACLGCTSGTCGKKGQCVDKSDCNNASATCVNCQCVVQVTCNNGDACQMTETCVNGICTTGTACGTIADCHTGQQCTNGNCTGGQGNCYIDLQCGACQKCDPPFTGQGTCVALTACDILPPEECAGGTKCTANQDMMGGVSTCCMDTDGDGSDCASGSGDDCAPGEICLSNDSSGGCYVICDTSTSDPCDAGTEQCYPIEGIDGAGYCALKPECDLFLQDCTGGKKCSVNELGIPTCQTPGTGATCYTAGIDDCPKGMLCLDANGFDCYDICETANNNGCQTGITCSAVTGIEPLGVCVGACNPVRQKGCGWFFPPPCKIVDDLPTCQGSSGSCADGTGDDCAKGSTCFAGSCRVLCNVNSGISYSGPDCGTDKTCVPLPDVRTWGVCMDSCGTDADCSYMVCNSGVCTPCNLDGAPACSLPERTCNQTTGLCELPADQAVGDSCGTLEFGDCATDLVCLANQGDTFGTCYQTCDPATDPFCQPDNLQVCMYYDDTNGYCETGGTTLIGDYCDPDILGSCVDGGACLCLGWFCSYYCYQACDSVDNDPGCQGDLSCQSHGESPFGVDLGYCD